MKSPSRRSTLPVAALGCLLAACSPGASRRAEAPAGPPPARLAVAVPLSGPLEAEGRGQLRAVRLAVEQANASGTLPVRVEVEAFDDKGDPQEAIEVAAKIALRGDVAAVIGHYTSGCAIPAAKLYALGPVAMVSASATSVRLTAQQLDPGWPGERVAFRVVPTDAVQGAYAAAYARRTLKAKRVSILHDRSPYGEGLAGEFSKTFSAAGGSVISDEALSAGDRDFRALLARIAKDKPDALYYGGHSTEAGLVVAQAREAGLKVPFLTGDGARTERFFEEGGEAAEGALLTVVGVPAEQLPGAASFVQAYRARYQGPDETLRTFDHFAYEAAQTVIEAFARAGRDGAVTRAEVLAALRATKRPGLFGTTAFDEKGDAASKTVSLLRARASDRTFPLVESSAR